MKNEFSRRDFLKLSCTLAELAVLGSLGLARALDSNLNPPGAPDALSPTHDLDPGALEQNITDKPPFLSIQGKGCRNWVDYICTHNNLLSTLLRVHYKRFFYSQPEEPYRLGELLDMHVTLAYSLLINQYPDAYGDDLLREAIHYGMYTLAHVYFVPEEDPHFLDQREVFGVTLEKGLQNRIRQHWSAYRANVAGRYPVPSDLDITADDSLKRNSGIDRTAHTIIFMTIAYLDEYFYQAGMAERDAIPPALKALRDARPPKISSGKQLATYTGLAGEFFESLRYVVKEQQGTPTVREGVFDPYTPLDLRANSDGALVGGGLATVETWQDYYYLIDELNADRYYQPLQDDEQTPIPTG